MISLIISSTTDPWIICQSGVTCLPAYCCFNEQALLNPTMCVALAMRTSSSSYRNVTCFRHDIGDKVLT